MRIAGERAAVVPGHGEGLHRSCNTTPPGPIPRAPRFLRQRPAATPAPGRDHVDDGTQAQPEHRADHGTAEHVGRVVGPQVDAAGGDRRGKADVGRGPGVGVPEDERRAEGGEGMAAREAAARGRADGGGKMLVRPLPLDGRLDHPAHDERREPGGAERDDGAPSVGPAPACLEAGQQHPDEAVVGQVGDDGRGAIDARPPPQRLEGGVDRLVEGAHCGPVTRRTRGRLP